MIHTQKTKKYYLLKRINPVSMNRPDMVVQIMFSATFQIAMRTLEVIYLIWVLVNYSMALQLMFVLRFIFTICALVPEDIARVHMNEHVTVQIRP